MESRVGKLPQVPQRLGALPVEYRKLKTHYKRIIKITAIITSIEIY